MGSKKAGVHAMKNIIFFLLFVPSILSAEWKVMSKDDPLTDQRVVYITQDSDGDKYAYIKADGSEFDFCVYTDEYLDSGSNKIKGVIRLGKESPITLFFVPGTKAGSIFFPGDATLVKDTVALFALTGGQLLVRAYKYNGAHVDTYIDLDGLKEALVEAGLGDIFKE